jgi:hypothetical protein
VRHGLDFVDLENPQVGHPPVRVEQRIMIGTEVTRCALRVNRGVKHTADVGARYRAAVHADADEATRELVHDHAHPVAPEQDRLAMMRAIRGQPNRGLRDLSSTMARMTPSSGPFGPGFFGQGLEENNSRYLRRTNA